LIGEAWFETKNKGNKKRGRSPVFFVLNELLRSSRSGFGRLGSFSSRSSSRSSGFSRLGGISSRGGSRSSGFSRLGGFSSRSGNRGRSGSRSFRLLATSGQGNGEQSSNEDRLIHGISLSTRGNKI
jgi:hypothetical protein